MTEKQDNNETNNLKVLKRLKELPKGTSTENRVAAIQSLLREKEIFQTIKALRWPKGVVCPKCGSTNVVQRDPPKDSKDKRQYYVCLDCEKEDSSGGNFDDFTGLPISTLYALRQWILCWYLIGVCPLSHIARVLGLSVEEVTKIALSISELTVLPKTPELSKTVSHHYRSWARNATDEQEERTRSESKTPLKPGPKSKT